MNTLSTFDIGSKLCDQGVHELYRYDRKRLNSPYSQRPISGSSLINVLC